MYVDGQLFYTICIMELVSDTSSEDFYKQNKQIKINKLCFQSNDW